MEPPRWKIITPSQYEWERRELDFIRSGLPNHDPYRAWANFEFQTPDGAIYEIDLLVLTKKGFWLVEIKSWPGRVGGDVGTWTRSKDDRTISEDNPVLLANRKAKALISLLKSQHAVNEVRVLWLDAVVFLSADDIHAFLWMSLDAPQLSQRGRELIADTDNELLLSPASYWEIAIKIRLGNYELDEPLDEFVNREIVRSSGTC